MFKSICTEGENLPSQRLYFMPVYIKLPFSVREFGHDVDDFLLLVDRSDANGKRITAEEFSGKLQDLINLRDEIQKVISQIMENNPVEVSFE